MSVPEGLFDDLPDDSHEAAAVVATRLAQHLARHSSVAGAGDHVDVHAEVIEVCGAYEGFLRSQSLTCEPYQPTGNPTRNASKLTKYFHAQVSLHRRARDRAQIDAAADRVEILRDGVKYEFAPSELERIQELINRIRGEISAADSIPENHRLRLLRRLEKLQAELHEPHPKFQRFLGSVLQLGRTLRAFHSEVSPVIEDAKEILSILYRVQARGEDLPSQECLAGTENLLALPEPEHGEDCDDSGEAAEDH